MKETKKKGTEKREEEIEWICNLFLISFRLRITVMDSER
jgi:hypothetical protein